MQDNPKAFPAPLAATGRQPRSSAASDRPPGTEPRPGLLTLRGALETTSSRPRRRPSSDPSPAPAGTSRGDASRKPNPFSRWALRLGRRRKAKAAATLRTLAPRLQAARGNGSPSAPVARYLHAGSHSSTKGQTHPGNQASEYSPARKPILPRLRRVQCACAAGLPGLVFLKGLYLPPCNAPLSPTEKTTSPTEHCCVVSDLLQVNRYFAENTRYPFRILESFI